MHLVVDKSVVPHVGESVVLNIELTASESHEGYWLYFFRKSFKPKFEFKYILCYLKINLLRQYFWTIKWNLIFFLHIFHYILNIITGELEYFFLVWFANSLLFYLFFKTFHRQISFVNTTHRKLKINKARLLLSQIPVSKYLEFDYYETQTVQMVGKFRQK